MTTSTTTPISATTFTVCALVRTHTATVQSYQWDPETDSQVGPVAVERTSETGRAEFIAAGEWVFVKIDHRSCHGHFTGTWTAYSRQDARALYRELTSGSNRLYGAGWQSAPAQTVLLGEVSVPARSTSYAWGEGANRVANIDLPAARCPVIRQRHRSVITISAMQAFAGTFEGYSGHHIHWTELDRRYV